MNFYIVGGAVRDALMGKEPHDYDIVVEGATPEKMKELGFISVGKSFPVFLHPKTKMEFALCRKEIKTGERHQDFDFIWDNVSINDDLKRRDFTINALACACDVNMETGEIIPITLNKEKKIDNCYIIDNHNGFQDLRNGIIKIIDKEHFIEDPLRILRFCRFMATLDFKADTETLTIIKQMVKDGMLNHLTSERIWKEMEKALQPNANSRKFFEVMNEIGALEIILPEIYQLTKTIENPKYHSAGTTFGHIMCALDVIRDCDAQSKFGVLCHDIGKFYAYSKTKADYENANKNNEYKSLDEYIQYLKKSGSHYNYPHDIQEYVDIMKQMAKRISAPYSYIDCAKNAILNHMKIWKVFDGMKLKGFYEILVHICGTNFSDDFDLSLERFLNVCHGDNDSDKTENCNIELQNIENLSYIVYNIVKECKKLKLKNIPNYLDIEPINRSDVLAQYRIKHIKPIFEECLERIKKGDIHEYRYIPKS